MNIHEYQAKQLFVEYGVSVPDGQMASSIDRAVAIYREVGSELCVIKAQIHAGGRGKGHIFDPKHYDPSKITIDEAGVPHVAPDAGFAPVLDGGVKLVRTAEEVQQVATQMLSNLLVTKQTGPAGKTVHAVLIEAGCAIEKELYLAFTVDRAKNRAAAIVSAQGGMDIEVVAERSPEAIKKVWFQPHVGLWPYQAREVAFAMGLTDKAAINGFVKLMLSAARAFSEIDASLVEINPVVVTRDNEVMALDAKISFDDNALFRHRKIAEMRDLAEEAPAERKAHDHDLAYIKLDGDIGCLVNGAGLAMATMDIIEYHGKGRHSPANFLDVGGGADETKVKAAFEIILQDSNVKAILVNIFGGIMRCDTIANGVVAASKAVGIDVPLVVRLQGNMMEEGKQILRESGLNITPADDMTDAAQKVVRAVEAA